MAVLDKKECQLQSGNKTSSTTLKSKYQKVQIEEEVLKTVSTKRRLQTADCRLQTGYKMQTTYKMQTADCRPGTKCRPSLNK